MRKDRIDVIIPAFKAHSTIIRCLSSIACQTIIDDVSVVIVNDCCPEGNYSKYVEMFSEVMDIREIVLPANSGPGIARQAGIDGTDGEFFTCVDADDSLLKVDALEILRKEIKTDDTYMSAWASFRGKKHGADPAKFCRNPVWMFGKLYRREFVQKYKIRFNETRANEDTGYNHIVKYLCDSELEKIRYVEDNVYFYIARDDSITRINNSQYYYDQCIPGCIDNIIYAIEFAKRYRPFSEGILTDIVGMMIHCYFWYADLRQNAPMMTIQLWEYIKKFYHRCYKSIEGYISDETFRIRYSEVCKSEYKNSHMFGVVPLETIQHFMDRLHKEPYDPNLINEIREEMEQDPQYQEIMKNNIACGVCPDMKEVEENDL